MKRMLIWTVIVVFGSVVLWRLGCVHAVVVGNGTFPTNFLGARTKVVFRVVDDEGTPVPDVKVATGFWLPWNDHNCYSGQTDINGDYTVRATSVGEMVWSAEKYGYYKSSGTDVFFLGEYPGGRIKFGRWQPYGAVKEVVLKRKKNPVPMKVHFSSFLDTNVLHIPVEDMQLGFDVLEWDWCSPYGKGKTGDIQVYYSIANRDKDRPWVYDSTVTLSLTNCVDGIHFCRGDGWSFFRSCYRADGIPFERSVSFSYYSQPSRQSRLLEGADYLVFRIRTKTDETGEITHALYGKIYAPIEFKKGRFFLNLYLNMRNNDTNLEWEPTKNLLPGGKSGQFYSP